MIKEDLGRGLLDLYIKSLNLMEVCNCRVRMLFKIV